MTDGETLAAVGAALHGAHWQGQLADTLDVAPRTIGRWVNGAQPIPPGVWAELLPKLTERFSELLDELSVRSRENPALG